MKKKGRLDFTHFSPEVFQAVAGENYTVYAYMNDGNVRIFDMKPLIQKGGVFKVLKDEAIFRQKLTVLNQTVAWDLTGNRNESDCIDIDPFSIFEGEIVSDFPEPGLLAYDEPFSQTFPALDRVSETNKAYNTETQKHPRSNE